MTTIRPIDMQVLIPRTTDVGKMQQIANQQGIVDQQLLGDQMKQLAEHRQHQVQHLLQAEGGKVTPNKEKNERQQQRKKKSALSQEQSGNNVSDPDIIVNRPNTSDPVRGHSIDIIT